MTDRDLAETICRALIMIVKAIIRRYGLEMRVPELREIDT